MTFVIITGRIVIISLTKLFVVTFPLASHATSSFSQFKEPQSLVD